jgi:hypothetical protein
VQDRKAEYLPSLSKVAQTFVDVTVEAARCRLSICFDMFFFLIVCSSSPARSPGSPSISHRHPLSSQISSNPASPRCTSSARCSSHSLASYAPGNAIPSLTDGPEYSSACSNAQQLSSLPFLLANYASSIPCTAHPRARLVIRSPIPLPTTVPAAKGEAKLGECTLVSSLSSDFES